MHSAMEEITMLCSLTDQLREIRKASFAQLYCDNVPNVHVREFLLLKESARLVNIMNLRIYFFEYCDQKRQM